MAYNEQLFTRIREAVEILTGQRGDASKSGAAVLRRDLAQLRSAVESQAGGNGEVNKTLREIEVQLQALQTGKLGVNSQAKDSEKLAGMLPGALIQTPHGTSSGPANAQVVTVDGFQPPTLSFGDQYRIRFSTANTGAATVAIGGFGAIPLATINGGALPAGYLRTSVDTLLTMDAGFFRADRLPERGGSYVRYADGSIELSAVIAVPEMAADEVVSVQWDFPVSVMFPVPSAILSISTPDDAPTLLGVGGISTGTGLTFFVRNGPVAQETAIAAKASARWY